MASFMQEDVAVANHSTIPPLRLNFPGEHLDVTTRGALRACLEHKWNAEIGAAQQKGWIPGADELAALPIFQQAALDDAEHIRSMQEDAVKRDEMRIKLEEEAQRAEEESVRRQLEAKAEEARQRTERKESRRLERMLAKEEARAKQKADIQRRYDELHAKWQETVEERAAALETARQQMELAHARKRRVDGHLADLEARKNDLVKQLRDLATRPSGAQKPESKAIEPADRNERHTFFNETPRSPPRYSLYRPFSPTIFRGHSYDTPVAAGGDHMLYSAPRGSPPSSPTAASRPRNNSEPRRSGTNAAFVPDPSTRETVKRDKRSSHGGRDGGPLRSLGMRTHTFMAGGWGRGQYTVDCDDGGPGRDGMGGGGGGSVSPLRSQRHHMSGPRRDGGAPPVRDSMHRDSKTQNPKTLNNATRHRDDHPGGDLAPLIRPENYGRPLTFEQREFVRQQQQQKYGGRDRSSPPRHEKTLNPDHPHRGVGGDGRHPQRRGWEIDRDGQPLPFQNPREQHYQKERGRAPHQWSREWERSQNSRGRGGWRDAK